jgi:TonB family protein
MFTAYAMITNLQFTAMAAATAAPAAAASSCTVPDSEPHIVKLVPPLYSEAMRERGKTGIVDVTVSLNPDGGIAKAVVTRSAGDDLLDAATYTAATATTYAPEVKGCRYLAGSYIFRARYRAAPALPVASAPHPLETAPPVSGNTPTPDGH